MPLGYLALQLIRVAEREEFAAINSVRKGQAARIPEKSCSPLAYRY